MVVSEIFVYDPTDGKIINPQASHALHDRPQCVLTVDSILPEKSKTRRDSLLGKLSAIRISLRENQEREKRDETSDFPESNTSSAEIFKSMPNEKLSKAIEGARFGEDDSRQTRTASENVDKKSKLEAATSDSPADRVKKKSRNRTDESMKMKIRPNKTVKDVSGNHGTDTQGDVDEQNNNGKIGEESGTDLYFQAVRRIKPLEIPVASKRRCAPTGKVSPMVREISGKSTPSAADASDIVTEPPAKFSEFAAAANKSNYIAWPTATTATTSTWQHPSDATSVTPTPQITEATTSKYGAHVEHRNRDAPKNNANSNSNLFFAAEPSASNGSRVQAEGGGGGRGKKSSLKVDRRRSNRAKRHVSYSDTDTIYPFDSTDDMADESEVDSTPFRLPGEIFADGGRLNRTQPRHPLTLRNHRQKRNPVVSVHPSAGGLGRRNTMDVFPAMTQQWNNPFFYGGSDGSTTLPPRFGASLRHSGIDVIPETPEEHSVFAAGLANINRNNRSKEYFEMADLGNFEFDNHRRGANSMISVGGARNGNNINPMSFSKVFSSPEYNQATTNNNSLRRQILNEAGNQSRRTAVEYIGPNGAASDGHFAWRQEGKAVSRVISTIINLGVSESDRKS